LKIYKYNIELVPEILQIPGMISINERKFLFQYGLEQYRGLGKIIDLGCWLGATTISLAAGLSKNLKCGEKNKNVVAYDLFTWDQSYNKHIKGSRFENLKLYHNIVEIKRDIIKARWTGEKIEFLLIDAMKTPVVTRAIIDEFYSCLIRGKSFVYHQDFDHYLTPWVHILIYLHKPYCKHIHDVSRTGGTVFKVEKSIPKSVLEIDFMNVDESFADNAFKFCISIASELKRNGIAAAQVMYYIYQRKFEKAFIVWTDHLLRNYELSLDFIGVKKIFDKLVLLK